MANEDKALLLVLDLRKKEEKQALEIFTAAMNKVEDFKRQIAEIKRYKQEYINDMENKGRMGVSTMTLLSYQAFLQKLENIEFRQEQDLYNLELDLERKRKFYLDKQKDRKIIEVLLENHKKERAKKEAMREQKLLDEYVIASTSRKKNLN